jgi:hypothetical protein
VNIELLNKIKEDILFIPLGPKGFSTDFSGVIVDGRPNITFADLDAPMHSFRVFSEYNYPIWLYLSKKVDYRVIAEVEKKYNNIDLVTIDSITDIVSYSNWMFNVFPTVCPSDPMLCIQSDGFLIQNGWEDYINELEPDFIGAPWRSENRVITSEGIAPVNKFCNGGVSFRKKDKMLQVLNYVNSRGGQAEYFRGLIINNIRRLAGHNLAEDAMFGMGFSLGMFKPITLKQAAKFALEPISYRMYCDKDNKNRPYTMHKIDF